MGGGVDGGGAVQEVYNGVWNDAIRNYYIQLLGRKLNKMTPILTNDSFGFSSKLPPPNFRVLNCEWEKLKITQNP